MSGGMLRKPRPKPWTVWSGLALLVVLHVLALVRSSPPSPLPADAPAGSFSAERAAAVLSRVLGDGAPHPIGLGSGMRERVVAELEALGLHPEVQEWLTCGRNGVVGLVHDVIATLPGATADSKSILVCAHYDSVAAGPGAADDGAGVAALIDVARAASSDSGRKHPLVFLVDDGEEAGLLGAQAFVERSPLARDVGCLLNL